MSIQAMISSLKNNDRRKKRNSVFEKDKNQSKSNFGEFVDHKKMNTYEHAAFQKKIFKERKRIKKRNRILLIASFIIAIILLSTLPSIFRYYF